MAELQMTNKTMKSVSGQRSDKTLARYIEKAEQTRLADSAIGQLAAWERSLEGSERDEKSA